MSMKKKPVILLTGPTACGKSSLALSLCSRFNGVIINADSLQIYQELSLLTACPSQEDFFTCPHLMYQFLRGNQTFSVAQWRECVIKAIDDCHKQSQLPLITGGTGLYFKALVQGLSSIPSIDSWVEKERHQQIKKKGISILMDQIIQNDPQMKDYIDGHNPMRVERAWDVMCQTGKSLRAWHESHPPCGPNDLIFFSLCMEDDRENLYHRAHERLHDMVEQGVLDQVREVMDLDYGHQAPVKKACGYVDFEKFCRSQCSLAEALEGAKKHTRHYIKRQITWLRHQYYGDNTIRFGNGKTSFDDISIQLDQFLLTHDK